MNKFNTFFVLLVLSVSMITLFFLGCSDNNNNGILTDNNNASYVVSVFPSAGSTDISTNTAMSIKFSQPMDTSSFMNNFHFSGGTEMHEWMDSSNFYGGMGQMNMGMNTLMMNWMDSIQITGTFNWNNNFDSCEFMPDSTMLSNTDYMMLMYEGGMMNQSGGMMQMNHGDDGYHTYQFMTGGGTAVSPSILNMYPQEGDTTVSVSSSMSITFNMPMDTFSVMDNFHFSGGTEMHEWMDSLNFYGGMGQMNMGMNTHMMNWMDSIQISGTFHWNNNFDSCEFIPDSTMMSNTDYMIFMDENNMMSYDSSMMGIDMNHNDEGFHQNHFTTE